MALSNGLPPNPGEASPSLPGDTKALTETPRGMEAVLDLQIVGSEKQMLSTATPEGGIPEAKNSGGLLRPMGLEDFTPEPQLRDLPGGEATAGDCPSPQSAKESLLGMVDITKTKTAQTFLPDFAARNFQLGASATGAVFTPEHARPSDFVRREEGGIFRTASPGLQLASSQENKADAFSRPEEFHSLPSKMLARVSNAHLLEKVHRAGSCRSQVPRGFEATSSAIHFQAPPPTLPYEAADTPPPHPGTAPLASGDSLFSLEFYGRKVEEASREMHKVPSSVRAASARVASSRLLISGDSEETLSGAQEEAALNLPPRFAWQLHPLCLGPLPQLRELEKKTSSAAADAASRSLARVRRLRLARAAASSSLSPSRRSFGSLLDAAFSAGPSEEERPPVSESLAADSRVAEGVDTRDSQERSLLARHQQTATTETALAFTGLKLLSHRLQNPHLPATPRSAASLTSRTRFSSQQKRAPYSEAAFKRQDADALCCQGLAFGCDGKRAHLHGQSGAAEEQLRGRALQTQIIPSAWRVQRQSGEGTQRESEAALASLCTELRSCCNDLRRQLEIQHLKIEALEERVSTLKRQHQLSYELLVQQRRDTDALGDRQDKQEVEIEQQTSAIWRHQQSLSLLQHKLEETNSRCARCEARVERIEVEGLNSPSPRDNANPPGTLVDAESKDAGPETSEEWPFSRNDAADASVATWTRGQPRETPAKRDRLPQTEFLNESVSRSSQGPSFAPENEARRSKGDAPLLSKEDNATPEARLSEENLLAGIASLKEHLGCIDSCSQLDDTVLHRKLLDPPPCMAPENGAESEARPRFVKTASRSNDGSSANEFKSASSIFSYPSLGTQQVASEGSSPQSPYIWKTDKGQIQEKSPTGWVADESKDTCKSPTCVKAEAGAKLPSDIIPKLRLALTPPLL